jgi:hypothetical protein
MNFEEVGDDRDFWVKLRSATLTVPIPENLNGLAEAAALAYEYEKKFSEGFYNTKRRGDILSDATYLALVLSILKKRCGIAGAQAALHIIQLMEQYNNA